MSSNEKYNYFCMFTPEGKIQPLEGVIRSTEHGSPCVALRNKNMALIIAQRTNKNSKLTEGKTKIKQLDTNLIYVYSGITNDGIEFGNSLRDSIQHSKYIQEISLPIDHSMKSLQFNNGIKIMQYGKRASGISAIIAGIDRGQIKIIEMTPTGEAIPCFGACIGSRAQSARTILESHAENIYDLSDSELLSLGLSAFKNAANDPNVISSGYFDVCKVSYADGVVFTPGSEISVDA